MKQTLAFIQKAEVGIFEQKADTVIVKNKQSFVLFANAKLNCQQVKIVLVL